MRERQRKTEIYIGERESDLEGEREYRKRLRDRLREKDI